MHFPNDAAHFGKKKYKPAHGFRKTLLNKLIALFMKLRQLKKVFLISEDKNYTTVHND